MYRASIENEVCWPVFATEKGSSRVLGGVKISDRDLGVKLQ